MMRRDPEPDPRPAPLAPGECVEVFAATRRAPTTGPDALEELDAPNAQGFVPLTHRFSRRRFRDIFTLPESVILVSHTNCGCGFGFGLPDASDEQIIEAFLGAPQDTQLAAQNDADDLVAWLTRQCDLHGIAELWITTNDPARRSPTRVTETTTDTLHDAARTFRVGDLIRVTRGAYAEV